MNILGGLKELASEMKQDFNPDLLMMDALDATYYAAKKVFQEAKI